MKRLGVSLGALICVIELLSVRALADGYRSMELYQWNEELKPENWRVFLGAQSTETLGVFLTDPLLSDANSAQVGNAAGMDGLRSCGIEMVELKRKRFSSPFLPNELTISTPESRGLSPTVDNVMLKNPQIRTVVVRPIEAEWSRLLTNETTSLLYTSAIWGDPATRAALITCIKSKSPDVLTESKLTVDAEIQFRDSEGGKIRINALHDLDVGLTIFSDSVKIDDFTVAVINIKLARRRGVCVTDVVFFRNPLGNIGTEQC